MFNCRQMIPGLLTIITIMAACCWYQVNHPHYLETERFIQTKMTNPNGLPATYLTNTPVISPDLAHGRDALSESVGLELEYALLKGDPALFAHHAAILNRFFVSPAGLVYWRLNADGSTAVTTNALVDDLRIIHALLQAKERWKNPSFGETAARIGSLIAQHQLQHGLPVDFYDSRLVSAPDTLTLSYLNMPALLQLRNGQLLPPAIYDHCRQLLAELPTDGVFYPKTYHLSEQKFQYDETVNVIDQLLILEQRRCIGCRQEALYAFLRQEFYRNHVLYGTYWRQSRSPAGSLESPAVYALMIIQALDAGDTCFALDLHRRMSLSRSTASEYRGGYIAGGNTHLFDNVYPQIAELRLRQALPLYFTFFD